VRRVAIYAHWDGRNEVKRYVEYYVRRLREECDEVIFVSTSQLAEAEVDKVRPWCTQILLKENIGYDFAMWRDVILGLDLTELDELLLTNSSVFGPLRSLRGAFERMAQVACDFWGMSDCELHDWHLQSYFLVFRRSALASPCFLAFWRSVLSYRSKRQAIYSYEIGLSTFLSENGLIGRAFAPFAELSEMPPKWPWSRRSYLPPLNTSVSLPYALLERQMPFVKVEVLRDNTANLPLRPLRRAIKATGYDVTMLEFDPR
jgi:lipopolysaccharide biosynthesis protein